MRSRLGPPTPKAQWESYASRVHSQHVLPLTQQRPLAANGSITACISNNSADTTSATCASVQAEGISRVCQQAKLDRAPDVVWDHRTRISSPGGRQISTCDNQIGLNQLHQFLGNVGAPACYRMLMVSCRWSLWRPRGPDPRASTRQVHN